MKLTHKNYFTEDNTCLSNSDITVFLKCEELFYNKKILRNVEQTITEPLVVGSAVDEWLTGSEAKFRKKYKVVKKRCSKDDPQYRYQLTEKMYKSIVGMCKSVERTTAYKQMKTEKHQRQKILQRNGKIGEYLTGLCNIPDFYRIYEDGTCIITDLKTADASRGSITMKNWLYKCYDYGYFRQQAMAQDLLMDKYPHIKVCYSRHLIVEKDPLGIHRVHAWYLDQTRIEEAHEEIEAVIKKLKTKTDFTKPDVDWDNATAVGEYEE